MTITISIDPDVDVAQHGQSLAIGDVALLFPVDPAACVSVADRVAAALGEVRARAALRLSQAGRCESPVCPMEGAHLAGIAGCMTLRSGINRIVVSAPVTTNYSRSHEAIGTVGDAVSAWRTYEHDEELHSGRSFIAPPFIVGCPRCESEYAWRLRNGMSLVDDAQAAS